MRQITFLPQRPSSQLLKWIGNKFKYAEQIVSYFPEKYNKYIEPFIGTGAVLATLAPNKALAGDTLVTLIQFWQILQNDYQQLIDYYSEVIDSYNRNREKIYLEIKEKFNQSPNPYDLLIISRTCYGGVIRFTREGKISTPIGPHKPISPQAFASRVLEWREKIKPTHFVHQSFIETMISAEKGDIIYCDPPYVDSQSILYGSQNFSFNKLIEQIQICKEIGAKVALSIDGKKKSKQQIIELKIPLNLFEREIYLDCGSSMLKRFQKTGQIMIGEDVHERLFLTW